MWPRELASAVSCANAKEYRHRYSLVTLLST
jgi:hypothetical protein